MTPKSQKVTATPGDGSSPHMRFQIPLGRDVTHSGFAYDCYTCHAHCYILGKKHVLGPTSRNLKFYLANCIRRPIVLILTTALARIFIFISSIAKILTGNNRYMIYYSRCNCSAYE